MRRFFMVLIFIACSSQLAHAKTYVLKKGDTLASVARRYYGEPVFGTRGTLKKIYKLNPWARTTGSIVEPGQTLILEDLSSEKSTRKAEVEKAPIVEKSLSESGESPVKEVGSKPLEAPKEQPENQPEEKLKNEPVEAHSIESSAHHEAEKTSSDEEQAHHFKKDEYSLLPLYSLVNQTVTDAASNISYTLNANSYGAEFGWAHHWSESFSSVLTYAYSQISSSAVNNATGSSVLNSLTLNRFELALLNQLSSRIKFGLGLAYNDHLFLESFSATPANPSIYKSTFLNPFLNAEIMAYECEKLELLFNLKVGSLPAQNGQGHDLSSGTEFSAELAALEKFKSFALVYSLSYSTEDQTRVDAREIRNETMLKIGFVF
jgi:phage tail protein X